MLLRKRMTGEWTLLAIPIPRAGRESIANITLVQSGGQKNNWMGRYDGNISWIRLACVNANTRRETDKTSYCISGRQAMLVLQSNIVLALGSVYLRPKGATNFSQSSAESKANWAFTVSTGTDRRNLDDVDGGIV